MAPYSPPASRGIARPVISAALLTLGALTLSACGAEDEAASAGSGAVATTTQVTDATGTKVKIPADPERVVALSEMDLDASLALGVEPVGLTAGRGQKGAPQYLADQAKSIPVVGAVTGPDIEKVVRVKPDVILAGQLADEQVLAQLRKIAPTVVTIDGTKDWKKALQLTGTTLGRPDEAEKFLADYGKKAASLRTDLGPQAGADVSVARYSAKGTAVMQQGVFISDVLKDLGFGRPGIQNDKGEGHSTRLSDENLQEIDGDWLFIGSLDSDDADLLAELTKKPAYQQLGAVRDMHATVVDGTRWTSLGGAQAAVSVLDDIRKAMVK
ncbi:ABC transporter substrate-binding protein [Streptomyces sp. QL37]|uniref:ABC transporter substrate-binding protein n=1 Tax=Streptomyces sp. QL37 TaxID=2093747 RepID=UPI000CF1D4DC|nr:iron-siderophore ABC transporter substrate-binding protein [Streptomyces sp. QL37]PPQ55807.1 iron-siderophore ABC transporter substrate-binding protein [Streptomyces sp. QL37]